MLKKLSAVLVLMSALLIAVPAYASTPTLSISGGDDIVQLQVKGDASTSVWLAYSNTSGVARTLQVGRTDTEGYFSGTVSTSEYKIAEGGPVYVTMGSASGSRSSTVAWPAPAPSQIVLARDDLSIGVGQSTVVPVYDFGSGTLTVTRNSNASAASVSVNGGLIMVAGLAVGSTEVTVCLGNTTSNCDTLTITVTTNSTQAFSMSPSNPVVVKGQNTTVVIAGSIGAGFYASSNSNPSVAQVNITSNAIMLYGNQVGATLVTICQLQGSGCATLPVSVISANTTSTTTPSVNQENIYVTEGSTGTVLVGGGSGGYTLKSNNPDIATATLVNGTNIVVKGVTRGTATISACDSLGACAYVLVGVVAAPVVAPSSPSAPSVSPTASAYRFTTFLSLGASGTAVTNLQQRLTSLHFYSGPVTGYYGALTQAAVKKFQSAHKITVAGYVGPSTRAALNQ